MPEVNVHTDPDEYALAQTLRELVREAVELSRELPVAYSQQWDGNAADASLQHADPTGNVATDPHRLALRLAVIRSERALTHAVTEISAARACLAARIA